jgi:hypothetical protein
MRRLTPILGLAVLLVFSSPAGTQAASPSLLEARFASLPIHFVENRGPYPEAVRYFVQGKQKTLFFTRHGITFLLRGQDRSWTVKVDFVDSSDAVQVRGRERRRAVFSYFRGPKEAWKTGLPSFGEVAYENLWPGIDLVYRAEVGAIKYAFVVRPGADPGRIRLRYRGATSVAISTEGSLRVETPVATFEDAPPVAWQREPDGSRTPVEVAYAVEQAAATDETTVGFRVGKHAAERELVIDPAVFVYCGYLGGAGDDALFGVAVDPRGDVYVGGTTVGATPTFPVKVGPGTTYSGRWDGIVAKVDSSGTKLIYCGYIGGAGDDFVNDIAVDSLGAAYVIGDTSSTESSFPVHKGPDLTFNGRRGIDCFVAKVSPAGTGLVYCGYLGGEQDDYGYGIAVAGDQSAYLVGRTGSPDPLYLPHGTPFPTTVGPDLTFNGPIGGGPIPDAFVAKLDPSGTKWAYCGYIGGTGIDVAVDVAVDAQGNAYVAGIADSDETSFPVKVGPSLKHASANRYADGFVAKVNRAGTGLDYCGYIGGSDIDGLKAVAVDAGGHAYVAGATNSPANTLPLVVGPSLKYGGWGDVLVAKLSPSGSSLLWCGLLGGNQVDAAWGIGLDLRGNAYVAGLTYSTQTTFPVKHGPQLSSGGVRDGFLAKIDTSGRFLHYSGFVGGSHDDGTYSIAATPSGNVVVAGDTLSDERTFPVKVGPDLTFGGGLVTCRDGFIAKIKFTHIAESGAPRPGGTVTLTLTASDSAGLPYQAGSSLGTGPIPIDTRKLELSADGLLLVSVHDAWPQVFVNYRGVIGPDGEAQAKIVIPALASLVGAKINTAFVTLDPGAPSGIRDIADTVTIAITK